MKPADKIKRGSTGEKAMTERLEGSRETQRERCPTCRSFDRRVGKDWSGAESHLYTVFCNDKDCVVTQVQQPGAGHFHAICNDPWHSTPAAPETPPDSNALLEVIADLINCWDVFYTFLPDGEYRGLAQMRAACNQHQKLAVTPRKEEA